MEIVLYHFERVFNRMMHLLLQDDASDVAVSTSGATLPVAWASVLNLFKHNYFVISAIHRTNLTLLRRSHLGVFRPSSHVSIRLLSVKLVEKDQLSIFVLCEAACESDWRRKQMPCSSMPGCATEQLQRAKTTQS